MKNELEAYKKFRDERLKPDLAHWAEQVTREESKLADYKRLLANWKLPERVNLDLGAGYSSDLEVVDQEHAFVAVGFGFYCQMNKQEMEAFLPAKEAQLQKRIAHFEAKKRAVKKHLDTTERVIKELESLQ